MGRPLGVTVLALIASIIGILAVIKSVLSFIGSAIIFPFGFHIPDASFVALNLIVGLVWLFVAYAFWKGAKIGWFLGIVMAFVIIVLDFPLGSILGIMVLIYLLVPRGVRNWFSTSGLRNWTGI